MYSKLFIMLKQSLGKVVTIINVSCIFCRGRSLTLTTKYTKYMLQGVKCLFAKSELCPGCLLKIRVLLGLIQHRGLNWSYM